jgi:hypothetical protein
MNLEKVIEEIHKNSNKVVSPTADPQLWDKQLKSEFNGYPVFNWTDDFNYSKCHTYEILLHPGTVAKPGSLEQEQTFIRSVGGQKYSLLLKMSVIASYYLAGVFRRQLDSNGQVIEQLIQPEIPLQVEFLQKVDQFAQRNGFEPINRTYLAQVVPNVKLDLAQCCTVYNCLFEDEDNCIPVIWYK